MEMGQRFRVFDCHLATDHIVCTQQIMDGQETNLGREWVSAPKAGQEPSVEVDIA